MSVGNGAVKRHSLGSYVFAWGSKQEATAMWYGMLLPDGTWLEAVDTIAELWSGHEPAVRCPRIDALEAEGSGEVEPGATVRVRLNASHPDDEPYKVQWVLHREVGEYNLGGDTEAAPPKFPDAIVSQSNEAVELRMPDETGGYRLFAYLRDEHGGGATANIPPRVRSGAAAISPGAHAKLPFKLYGQDVGDEPFAASGWMGDVDAVDMNPQSRDNPHTGETCLKIEFRKGDG